MSSLVIFLYCLLSPFFPFFALPMPFTSTVLTFLNSYLRMSALHPQLFVNVLFWISGSYVAVSESLAYLVLLEPITLYIRYERNHIENIL